MNAEEKGAASPCPTIAIDGPSGSGKSTVARLLAAKLGFLFLDTGAMYRAVARAFLDAGWHHGEDGFEVDGEAVPGEKLDGEVEKILDRLRVDVDENGCIRLNGNEVEASIRSPEVSRFVSPLSALGPVRARMIGEQRRVRDQIGRGDGARAFAGIVAEGRDITTVVFPDATLRVFLDASLDERARRRHTDYAAGGARIEPKRVASDMAERDRRDRERALGPLQRSKGSVVIDSTSKSPDEVTDEILAAFSSREPHSRGGDGSM